jgi:hypothetical protein
MRKDFPLSGSFEEKPFPSLLVDLKESTTTGILLARKDAIEKKIFFLNGEPVACRSNRKKELLGEILCARGKITKAQLAEAVLEAKKQSGDNFGEILIMKGFVSQQELYSETKYQFISILFSLFGWEQGNYVFEEKTAAGLIPPGLPHFYVKFSKLISEGIRLIKKDAFIDRLLGSGDQLVKKTEVTVPSTDLSFKSDDQAVLNTLRDGMTVNQVVDASELEPGRAKRILQTLASLGVVEIGAPGSLLDAAAVAAALGEGEEAGIPALDDTSLAAAMSDLGPGGEEQRDEESWPLSNETEQPLPAEIPAEEAAPEGAHPVFGEDLSQEAAGDMGVAQGVGEQPAPEELPVFGEEAEASPVAEGPAVQGEEEALIFGAGAEPEEAMAPISDKIEAAVGEVGEELGAGPEVEEPVVEAEASLEEAFAEAAAEEISGKTDEPSAFERETPPLVSAEDWTLEESEEPLSPFATAEQGSGEPVLDTAPEGSLTGGESEPVADEEAAVLEGAVDKAAAEAEPEVEIAAAAVAEAGVKKKSSALGMSVLAGLSVLLIGLGFLYFLKGKSFEPPVPDVPAETDQIAIAEKSPDEIIRELAREGVADESPTAVESSQGVIPEAVKEGETPVGDIAETAKEAVPSVTEKAMTTEISQKTGEKESSPTTETTVPALTPAESAKEAAVSAIEGEAPGKEAMVEAKDTVAGQKEAMVEAKDTVAGQAEKEVSPESTISAVAEVKTSAPLPAKEKTADSAVAPVETVSTRKGDGKVQAEVPVAGGDWEKYYVKGLDDFNDGNLESAFKQWADAVRYAPDQAYVIQIELTSYLSYAARDIKEAAPDEKVFIVKTTLDDKLMYKVLCGVYPDKASAEKAFRILTPYLKAQKPYMIRAGRLKPKLME